MKKVLVAGTALMLAGAVASQAEAGVNLSGDARVTYIGKQDYKRKAPLLIPPTPVTVPDGYDDFFESRVGVNFDATAAAQGVSVKGRLYFDGYGFDQDALWNGQEKTQVSVDYAYLVAPLGDWTIKAGRINSDYSKFFSWNIRPTRVTATYKHGDMSITPFVGVRNDGGTTFDNFSNNDNTEYGLVVKTKLLNAWNLAGYVRYDDDQREGVAPAIVPFQDQSGISADIFLNNEGADCDFGFHAELAYKEAGVQGTGTQNDGLGGYVMLSKQVSAQFTPALLAGMTKNGFLADDDFGFVMVGGELSTQVMRVGGGVEEDGGLLFGAFVANYKASERMTLTGNLLYAAFDNDDPNPARIDDAIEVSGIIDYALNESASLTYKAGYLTPNVNDGGNVAGDAYFAHLLRLNIAF